MNSYSIVQVRSRCLQFRLTHNTKEVKEEVQAPTLRKSSRPKTSMNRSFLLPWCMLRSISTLSTKTITKAVSVVQRLQMQAKVYATQISSQHSSPRLTPCCHSLEKNAQSKCSIGIGSTGRKACQSSSLRSQKSLKRVIQMASCTWWTLQSFPP